MKRVLLFCFLISVAGAGCKSDSSTSATHGSGDGYDDGTYTASIDYYNSNTGTNSTYTLEVDIEGNELTKIHWPSGGWLDDSHFSPPDISDGVASFSSDAGADYTVRIIGEEGCCTLDSYVVDEDEIINERDEREEREERAQQEQQNEEEEQARLRREQEEEEEEQARQRRIQEEEEEQARLQSEQEEEETEEG